MKQWDTAICDICTTSWLIQFKVEHSAFYARIEQNALLVLLSEEFKTYIR